MGRLQFRLMVILWWLDVNGKYPTIGDNQILTAVGELLDARIYIV